MNEGNSGVARLARVAVCGLGLAALGALACGCSPDAQTPQNATAGGSKPSIVLIVIDTLRADAVSVYGGEAGVTPVLDRLAHSGVRYEHAYAPSSWTLPSHVSLFTGKRVDEHGVGLSGAKVVGDSLELLAEVLSDAGYETAGFAENPALGPLFGLDQGFREYAAPAIESLTVANAKGVDPTNAGFGLPRRVKAWDEKRDPSKPYFLFINIYDPHYSYQIRNENRFVPDDTTGAQLWYAGQELHHASSICDRIPGARDLQILRGLYLGDVSSADAKVGLLMSLLAPPKGSPRPITVVTSDHGEHFGENDLLAHRFTVHNAALHVPLVVLGGDSPPGTVVSQAVDLRGVHASILCWAGRSDCSGALPVDDAPTAGSEPLVSIFSDEVLTLPPEIAARMGIEAGYRDTSRSGCDPSDGVFGRMVAMLRYPMKLTWRADQPLQLHDLSWDPAERTNLIDMETPEALALREEMQRFLEESKLDRGYREDPDVHPLDAETARALEALGYID